MYSPAFSAYNSVVETMASLDLSVLVLFILAFFVIADICKNANPRNYPPGPVALPFVGNLFSLDFSRPHSYLTKLSEVYGDVFSFRIGRDKTVYVNGFRMVKEALVAQGENFVDRPASPMVHKIYKGNNGIFFSNGQMWKQQRRFALTTLRNLGLGKSTLEKAIVQESSYLQEEIGKERGEPFDPAVILNNAVSNIICQLVFGRRFVYTDQSFQTLLQALSEAMKLEGSMWAQLYEAFPAVMKHLPGPHNVLFRHYQAFEAFIRAEVEKHKQNLDHGSPGDYINAFLIEMENHKYDPVLGFDELNMVMCSLDLFLAGTETTSTSLHWGLLYMIIHTDIQEKVQAEIDDVIGHGRQPSMADRPNMPYTDAVIHEIQRMGNIVPLNPPRMANKDTTLGGFLIPKGTTLMANLNSVLFDITEWETPYTFNPAHFLDRDGKFVRREAFMPFSAGKRLCPGEGLARMELFLFFVSLLQKFSFSSSEGPELDLDGQYGVTRMPHPFKIHARPR
ncbi:cytochrome P450 2J2-like [Lampris incognitus]|uniref:cytochrome P450 2J2-like n=1 Tax=Lampris incognitus TaxID=2546036 RepID=UPI0024B553D8|nr:cytochrome P450 2J2-like [Lampris incognitus]